MLAALALFSCASDRALPAPEVSRLDPPGAVAGQPTAVTITGTGFYVAARREVGGDGVAIADRFEVTIGGVVLEDVVRVSDRELRAMVPPRVPIGVHPLSLAAPGGTAEVPDAFAVTPASSDRCDNALDDDADGLTDCLDLADCTAAACDDGDACTGPDLCTASGACAGPDCSSRDTACSTFACGPSGCVASHAEGAACDDGNACTQGDACGADGACGGTALNCPGLDECTVGTCLPDGRCGLVVRAGQPCSSGICLGDGTCSATTGSFLYAPSNFSPVGIAPAEAATIRCPSYVGFDTTTLSWNLTGGCAFPQPVPVRVNLAGGVEAVVLAWRSLTVSSPIYFHGTRPIILAVLGDARLEAEVYAVGHTTAPWVQGAGGSTDACGARAGAAGVLPGAGGGGGGSASPGGAGGASGAVPGGAAGLSLGPTTPEPLQGGCAGGAGGGLGAGAGGYGGGAIQISVAGGLVVSSIVSVNGSGGYGAEGDASGGGGGGSGGMLLLEAHVIALDPGAALTANGGAGAGGAAASSSQDGQNGSFTSGEPARGGNGSGAGGRGGDGAGAFLEARPGASSTTAGGGGGGGGRGTIFIRGTSPNAGACSLGSAVMSPSPVLLGCR